MSGGARKECELHVFREGDVIPTALVRVQAYCFYRIPREYAASNPKFVKIQLAGKRYFSAQPASLLLTI